MTDNSFVTYIRKHKFGDISDHLNWYLEIKDPILVQDYKAFISQTRSPLFFLIFAIFMTFIAIPGEIALLQDVINNLSIQYQVYDIFYFIIVILAVISSWVIVLGKKYFNFTPNDDHFNCTACLTILTIMISMRIIRFSIFPCDLSNMGELVISRECINGAKGLLSWETGGYLMLPPIIYITIIKESRLTIVMLSFFITLTTIGILCLLYYPWSLPLIFMWGLLGIFLFTDIHLQNIRTYFLKRKLVEILVRNENMNDINQAIEMRHMIANVAHDLKTPLSSFTTGVGLIDEVLKECDLSFSKSEMTLEKYKERLSNIGQYLEDIRNTNSFMVMAINRCIDYTKASKGMKLTPHQETINLLETLKLPLNCMKNIQKKIEIILNPISLDICRCIITDKQWLQENLLCLLSNAVKYSSSGLVTINVSLKDILVDDLPPPHSDTKPLKLVFLQSQSEFTNSPLRESFQALKNFKLDSSDQLELLTQSQTNDSFSNSNSEIDSKSISPFINKVLLFEVEDMGIGISDEAMQSLFNPFKQTQRLAGGTGLGLYSLAKRIEALGGNYGVAKRKDKKQGSLFWFSIPYKPDNVSSSVQILTEKQEIPGPMELPQCINDSTKSVDSKKELNINSGKLSAKIEIEEHESSPSDSNSKLSILLVDDSPPILKLTGLLLKKQHHQVYFAENGAIAIKMIEDRWKENSKAFDLVLMDLQMPVMDGLEATRRIRQLERTFATDETTKWSRQLIVGCSANGDNETTSEAFKAGVDAFMAKPFTIESFHNTIETILPKFT